MEDDKSQLARVGWVGRRNGKPAVILWQSANGTVGWRYKRSRREYESTVENFLKKFAAA